MGRLIKNMWWVFCEPFRMVNDFMFGDAHHIVSRKGWRRLNNNDKTDEEILDKPSSDD